MVFALVRFVLTGRMSGVFGATCFFLSTVSVIVGIALQFNGFAKVRRGKKIEKFDINIPIILILVIFDLFLSVLLLFSDYEI